MITKSGRQLSDTQVVDWTKFKTGSCELCGKYEITLAVIKSDNPGSLFFSGPEKTMLHGDTLACDFCIKKIEKGEGKLSLSKGFEYSLDKFANCPFITKSSSHKDFAVKMIFQLSNFTKTFETVIKEIYVVGEDDVPEEYRNSLNVILDFRLLNISRFRGMMKNPSINLLTLWSTGDTTIPRKSMRLLMFLAEINGLSQYINIWIWENSRIFHIDSFASMPTKDVQIKPKRVYKV